MQEDVKVKVQEFLKSASLPTRDEGHCLKMNTKELGVEDMNTLVQANVKFGVKPIVKRSGTGVVIVITK